MSKLNKLQPSELGLNLIESILFASDGFFGVKVYRNMIAKRERKENEKTEYTKFNKHIAMGHINNLSFSGSTKVA